ncbi:MAG: zinc-dependent alcohol dehydrogenase [Candidatus Dormibacteraceae bacterium]
MKAVAITEDRRIQLVEIERPIPGPGEVLLDVAYCGICGSDLRMLKVAHEMAPVGLVPGHEFTGLIATLGPGVEGWAVGERVAVLPMVPCRACSACRAGHPNLCEQRADREPGVGRQGGYAESVVVPVGMLRRLPSTIADAPGALVEPLAVAVRAVELSGGAPEEPVCVLGAGPIGVLTVIVLRARGVARVAVVEPALGRRAAVERLGVPAVPVDDALRRVPSLLGGERPLAVVDCTGHPSGAQLALELLAVGGRLTIAGLPHDAVPLRVDTMVRKEIVIRGSFIYEEVDFLQALDHIAKGRVPCEQIITTIARLEDAPAWFDDLSGGATEQVKVLLCPHPVTPGSAR